MKKPPKATPEQPIFTEQGKLSVEDATQAQSRSDWLAGPRSEQAGSDDKVRYGDLKNNQTTHWKVEER